MNASEKLTSLSLAAVYALRMLGMFLIIPVFALYAPTLVGGENKAWVGFAMGGAYGLTQAIFQLPLGMASDKWGRKKVIYIGLILFALGSFLAAIADNIYLLALARAIQGAGAVSAAVTALLADLTREQVRTRAMAMIGVSIGITFAVSMVLGPILSGWIGVNGIFLLTGILSLCAILTVAFLVPNPEVRQTEDKKPSIPLSEVLKNSQLQRLNFGIFALHTAQLALFMSLPIALVQLGLTSKISHGLLYLPIVLVGFIFMVPAIIYGEKKHHLKEVFVFAIGLMIVAQLLLLFTLNNLIFVCIALVLYFIAFNILEATLPSLVSKISPTQAKGSAMGVYNTAQSLGLFAGGAVGGIIFNQYGFSGIFSLCTVLMLIWFVIALTTKIPAITQELVFSLSEKCQNNVAKITKQLKMHGGIIELAFSEDNKTLYLKIAQNGVDETQNYIQQILSGESK